MLNLEDGLASTYHKVRMPQDMTATDVAALNCCVTVRLPPTAAGMAMRTLFDAQLAVSIMQPPTSTALQGRQATHRTDELHLLSSASSRSSPPRAPSPPGITELLCFACSPRGGELPECGSEAVEVAMATSWADAIRISYGGDAERLRAYLTAQRTRRFYSPAMPTPELEARKMSGCRAASTCRWGSRSRAGCWRSSTRRDDWELPALIRCAVALLSRLPQRLQLGGSGRAVHAAGVPTVVCWRTKVLDAAARIFARIFFQQLAAEASAQSAFDEATRAVKLCTRLAARGGPRPCTSSSIQTTHPEAVERRPAASSPWECLSYSLPACQQTMTIARPRRSRRHVKPKQSSRPLAPWRLKNPSPLLAQVACRQIHLQPPSRAQVRHRPLLMRPRLLGRRCPLTIPFPQLR